jgi:hypothetical protein
MNEVRRIGTGQRSALLKSILARQQNRAPIHSGTQLGIEMLAQGIDAWSENKLREQEEERQLSAVRETVDALGSGLGRPDPLVLGQTPTVANLERLNQGQNDFSQTYPFLNAAQNVEDPVMAAMLLQQGVTNASDQQGNRRTIEAAMAAEDRALGRTKAAELRGVQITKDAEIRKGPKTKSVLFNGQPAFMTDSEIARIKGQGGNQITPLPQPNLVPQSEYDKSRDKTWAGMIEGIEEDASQARDKLTEINTLDSIMQDPTVYTGTGAGALQWVKKAGRTVFGLEGIEGVGLAEQAQMLRSRGAMQLRHELPGPMSNADREFLTAIPQNIGNTAEGNFIIAEYRRRVEQRKLDTLELAYGYMDASPNQRLDRGWNQFLQDFMDENPIFSDADWAEMTAEAKKANQVKIFGDQGIVGDAQRIIDDANNGGSR